MHKYPRTPHLPWSPGATSDDRLLKDLSHLQGKEIVATIKMDGENTTLYNDNLHARSIDSRDHESRHWMKAFHAQVRHHIPEGWRVCGENLFAKHSIKYFDLPSYFLVFSVWTNENECLSWRKTTKFCEGKFDVVTVFHTGVCDSKLEQILTTKFNGSGKIKFRYPFAEEHEGYVVRLTDSFLYTDFDKSVAKYVRKGHVQTDTHWMFKKVERNELM